MQTGTAVGSFTVASPDLDAVLDQPIARCVDRRRAGSLPQLDAALRRNLPASNGVPQYLDLLGHSTTGHRLLRLGRTPIDMLDPPVAAFFHALAADDLLPQRNIVAVRLLGCDTATTDAGCRTLRMLSRTLRLPVYGTLVPLLNGHYTEAGFNDAFVHQLVAADALVA
ncbi:hypothetical protein [Nocardia altamirensis]|uniref:hypothetical protein n=1 Tax=Nocardia altamirensis TaxID=472158 RepID=UPI0008408A56|nr:hypothetical protein [Nocardia altamirensis]